MHVLAAAAFVVMIVCFAIAAYYQRTVFENARPYLPAKFQNYSNTDRPVLPFFGICRFRLTFAENISCPWFAARWGWCVSPV